MNGWIGFILLTSPAYRDGVQGVTATVGANSVPVNYPSPHGTLAGLYLIAMAGVTAAFERCSWMNEERVHVEPWMWNVRAVGYLALSTPGFWLIVSSDYPLMPPLVQQVRWFCSRVMHVRLPFQRVSQLFR